MHLAPGLDTWHLSLRRGAMAKITAKQPWMMLKYTGSSIVLGPNQPLYFCATEETTIRHRSMTASSASQVQFQHIFSSVFIFLSCAAADPEVKVFISPCILPFVSTFTSTSRNLHFEAACCIQTTSRPHHLNPIYSRGSKALLCVCQATNAQFSKIKAPLRLSYLAIGISWETMRPTGGEDQSYIRYSSDSPC